jgi:imidazolonepropionase-like amidohydrolase
VRHFNKIFLACVVLSIANSPAAAETDRMIIVHAGTLLAHPGKAPAEQQSIVISSGKILEIRDGFITANDVPGDESSVEIVDLSDKFVLPGMMDAHVHFTLGRPRPNYVNTSNSDYAMYAASNAKKTLLAGFTTVRDLGAMRAESILAVRDAIERGDVAGPRIIAAGESISATAGHGDKRGMRSDIAGVMLSAAICDGPDDCRRAVRSQYKLGADTIKVHATGGGADPNGKQHSPPEMFDDELKAVVDAAHLLGLKVGAHAHGSQGIKAAIRAGVDSVEHSTWLDDEAIDLYLKHGTYMVRTGYLQDYFLASDIFSEEMKETRRENKAIMEVKLREAIQRGVKFAMGTDAGIMPHGDNAKEFAYYVEMGMTPMQAIETATVNAARLMGLEEEIGRLGEGMPADIVATDQSPLLDITALQNVTFVMKGGITHLLK